MMIGFKIKTQSFRTQQQQQQQLQEDLEQQQEQQQQQQPLASIIETSTILNDNSNINNISTSGNYNLFYPLSH